MSAMPSGTLVWTSWPILRGSLSLLLLVTAVLKLIGSASLVGGDGLLSARFVLPTVVGLEIFAAIVIAIAPSRQAHRFALVVFSIMACVAGWTWWTQSDCGCFGAGTPKGLPLLVDLVAVGLLIGHGMGVDSKPTQLSGVSKNASLRSFSRSIAVATFVGLCSVAMAAIRIQWQQADVLIPAWIGEDLVGQKMPTLNDDRFGELVSQAAEVWIVMLRPDCEHCRELVERWPILRDGLPPGVSIIGVSVKQNEWTVTPGRVASRSDGSGDAFQLRWSGNEPFVATPTVIAVREGVIQEVIAGDGIEELLISKGQQFVVQDGDAIGRGVTGSPSPPSPLPETEVVQFCKTLLSEEGRAVARGGSANPLRPLPRPALPEGECCNALLINNLKTARPRNGARGARVGESSIAIPMEELGHRFVPTELGSLNHEN